ncbi:MAG: hypothetical protein LC620_04905 [Halobacteriales archaeon]|nr:hypothetical protein [Halobacteriales archaeon]
MKTQEKPQRLSTASSAWVVPLERLRRRDEPQVGATAASLGELLHLGLEVPPGFAVTAAALQGSFGAAIDAALAGLDGARDAAAFDSAAATIRAAIDAAPLPESLSDAIHAAYEALCGMEAAPDIAVAVRPSALPGTASGDAHLNVRSAQGVLDAVRQSWSSFFTAQAIQDRLGRAAPAGLAVAVQRMVASESSGKVLHAGTGIVVESGWGLRGRDAAKDRFTVDKASLAVVSSEVVHKARQLVPSVGRTRIAAEEVDPERAEAPSLTPEEVSRLAELAVRIESRFGAPHDVGFAVEWVRASRRIRILQAAPAIATTMAPESARAPRPLPPAEGVPPAVTPLARSTSTRVEVDADPRLGIDRHADGVLLRGETVVGGENDADAFVAALAARIRMVASAASPRIVRYRFLDTGRGCFGCVDEPGRFRLECRALRTVRESGLRNVHPMLPSVRTRRELGEAKRILAEEGLPRTRDLLLWIQCDVPASVLAVDRLLEEGVDGVAVDVATLAGLSLRVGAGDASMRDLHEPAHPAVLRALQQLVRTCSAAGVASSAVGAEEPAVVEALVRAGVAAVTSAPNRLGAIRELAAATERRMLLDGVRGMRSPERTLPPPPLPSRTPEAAWWQGA